MAKMRMLQNNIAKSSDAFFYTNLNFRNFEWSLYFNQVSAALSIEGPKASKLLIEIDFTKSNEWTGLWK